MSTTTRLANKSEVAEWFEVSLPAVNGWIRRGCPYVQRGGQSAPWTFDLLAVAEWRYSRDVEASQAPSDPDAMDPLDRKYWYDGEKIRQDVEERKANLITIEEYQQEMARMLEPITACFEGLPDKIAHLLPPAAQAVAREEAGKVVEWLRSSSASSATSCSGPQCS